MPPPRLDVHRRHVEGVRHHGARRNRASPAAPREHEGAQRRHPSGVERRHQHVPGHDRGDAGVDRGPERHQLPIPQQGPVGVDAGDAEVRVGGGVAVAGEVLGAGAPRRPPAAPATKAAPCRATSAGVGAERAHADHRVGRVRCSRRRHGARSRSNPSAASPAPIAAATACGQRDVVDRAQGGVARARSCRWRRRAG